MSASARDQIQSRYDDQGIEPPRDAESGDICTHTGWNGWLYCEVETEPFDWETGNVECPHCGESFHVPDSSENGED